MGCVNSYLRVGKSFSPIFFSRVRRRRRVEELPLGKGIFYTLAGKLIHEFFIAQWLFLFHACW
jgi:hypothetical protein